MSDGAQDPEMEVLVSKIQRYRDWAQRMVGVVGPSFPRTIEARVANEWPALGAAFVFRATNILAATLDLPVWRLTAAAILVRSLYEHVTTFAWLATDPITNLTRWNLEDIRQAVKLHRNAVALGFDELMMAAKLEACERKLANQPRYPPMAERARAADAHWGKTEETFGSAMYSLHGMYPVIYRNFSSIVHGGGHSIRTLISAGPTPGMWCIGGEMGTGYSNAFTIAPFIFAMCLLASSNALGFPDKDAVLRCMRDGQGVVVD